MTRRFARAHLQTYDNDHAIIVIRVGNGDYFELSALDKYDAAQRLQDFSRLNNLILTEIPKVLNGSCAAQNSGGNAGRYIVSPIATSRSFSNRGNNG